MSFSFYSRNNKSSFKKVILFLLLSFFIVDMYSQYKTLGLTKKLNGNDEDGYILFTPIGTDTTFLINKCGQRIHSWRSEYTPGLSVYLKPDGHLLKTGTYTDTNFGYAGGRGGIIEEFDWDNRLVWRYRIFNDSLCQHHDIKLLPNGNVLVLAWHAISKTKAMSLGRLSFNFGTTQNDLWGERIIELKPIGKDSAEVVWEWDLFDHIVQDTDTGLSNYGSIIMHPELMNINYALNLKTHDWIHANGLDYNEELDQIVISCHNNSEIWIIDHSTTISESKTHLGGTFNKGGDLLYRWGNPEAYNAGTSSDRKLFRQHNASWIPNGYQDSGSIMIFNNGWNRDTAYSTIDVIKTPILSNGSYVSNLPYGPAKPSWTYKDSIPTQFYSQIISGAQRLPNGNTLICSGVQGRFFEVTRKGKIVWQYRNPVNSSGIQIDGQTANNNSVFRCVFYPKKFPAFKNRTLVASGPIEKNSYIYSCMYETVAPKIVSFSPKKNDTSVTLKRFLTMTADETLVKKSGNINIYQNNILFESIGVNSDLVKINNNIITIEHVKSFSVNSRISVSFLPGNFRDSSNNILAKGIDSSEWNFYTVKVSPKILALSPAHLIQNVKIDTKIELLFSEPMIKNANGNISIYENGNIKETIPVGSSKVVVQEGKVIITPSSAFSANTLIVVGTDSCFHDSFGIRSNPIIYGDWFFRTASYPKVLNITPVLNAVNVESKPILSMEFDKKLSIGNIKNILIFENNQLIETISVMDTRVNINGKFMNIDPLSTFKTSSRVGISVPDNMLVDTFGMFFPGIDSTEWHFSTEDISSVKELSGDHSIQIFPNPSQGKFLLLMNEELLETELFDFTGRYIPISANLLNDGLYEIETYGISPGHYMLRLNGVISLRIEIN